MFRIRDLRIGVKMGVGFGIVLVLLMISAWIGLGALNKARFRAGNVEDAGLLVLGIHEVELEKENFRFTHDKATVEATYQAIGRLRSKAMEMKNHSLVQENKEQMDLVLKHTEEYEENFTRIVKADEQNQADWKLIEEKGLDMRERIGILQSVIASSAVTVRKDLNLFMQDKITKVNDANKLRKLLGEAKGFRITLMYKDDAELLGKWKETNKQVFELTADLKSRFKNQANIDNADKIFAAYKLHESTLLNYLKNHDKDDEQTLLKTTTDTVEAVEAIAANQEGQLEAAWKKADQIMTNEASVSEHLTSIMENFLSIQSNARDFALSNKEEFLGAIADNLSSTRQAAGLLKARLTKPGDIAPLDVVATGLDEYEQILSATLDSLMKEKAMIESLKAVALTLEKICTGVNEDQKAKMEHEMIATRRLVTSATIAAIIFGGLVAFFITRAITSPVKQGVAFAQRIASLDLTSRIELRQNDEMGELVAAMNSMADTLSCMARDLGSGVHTLGSASSEMAGVAEQVAIAAETTSAKAEAVAAAAEQMTANMNAVAASMEQASANTSTVAASAEEMSASITEIAGNTARAKESTSGAVKLAEKASQQVHELGSAAKEIGVVTNTIKAISDKTNLLALNATIEAARAGEAGKGFAVVANEIKELAKRTAEATGEIAKKLQAIQKSTDVTVNEIEEVGRAIAVVDEIVSSIAVTIEEQSVTTSGMAENVSQTGAGIQEINENVGQTSSAVGLVASDITEVNHAAAEMKTSSTQLGTSASQLNSLAGQLKIIVDKFKV